MNMNLMKNKGRYAGYIEVPGRRAGRPGTGQNKPADEKIRTRLSTGVESKEDPWKYNLSFCAGAYTHQAERLTAALSAYIRFFRWRTGEKKIADGTDWGIAQD